MKSNSIVGFGTKREKNDFYPTPAYVTEALFEREKFVGNVWECASGDGSMSKVIEKYNECFSSDLLNEDWVYGEKKIDFLNSNRSVDNIITNPPYKFAKEFVLQAKRNANHKIAMLLKLVFLEGIGRYEMFQDTQFPLKSVYVFCKRVTMSANGVKLKNSGLIAYAWFVWDRQYSGLPSIEWIK